MFGFGSSAYAPALVNNSVSSATSKMTSIAFEIDQPPRASREAIVSIPSVAQAHVLVLCLVAIVDLVLPLRAIAVERGVAVRGRVGLALILPLLVLDHLRALAAARKRERGKRGRADQCDRAAVHDLVPPVAGAVPGAGAGCAPPGVLGSLYAVAQPHTSPPLPRCVTRSR